QVNRVRARIDVCFAAALRRGGAYKRQGRSDKGEKDKKEVGNGEWGMGMGKQFSFPHSPLPISHSLLAFRSGGHDICESHRGGVKTKVRVPGCFTGFPSRSVGLKTHFRAASSAAARSTGCPLMAFASITRPFSPMTIAT